MRFSISGILFASVVGAIGACQADPGGELDEVEGPADSAVTLSFIKPTRTLAATDGLALVGDDLWVAMTLTDAVIVIDTRTGVIKRVVASEADPDATELVVPDDLWRDPVTGDVYVSQVGAGTGGHVDRISPSGARTRILSNFSDNTAFPNGITGIHRPGEPVRLFISPLSFFGAKTGIFEIDPNGAAPPTLVYGAQNGVDVIGTGLTGGGNGMEIEGNELFTPVTFGGAVLAIDIVNRTARTVWNGNGGASRGVYVRFTADRTRLYFTEHSTGKLFLLDPDGPANQVPQFVAQLDIGVDGLAVHPDGRLFASNFITGGIQIVRPNGSVQQMFPLSMNTPNGIAGLPDGRLLVGDTASLSIVDPDAPVTQLPVRPKFFIDGDITQGVALRGSCDAYVTCYLRRNIQHFDVCAGVVNRATNIVPPLSMGLPNDVLLVGQTLYVADGAGVVWRMTVNGAAATTAAPFKTGLSKPSGLAFFGGKLYVSEFNANRISVFDAATGAAVTTITNLTSPEGLAVLESESILVVEANLGRVTRIKKNGQRKIVATGLGTQLNGPPHPFVNQFSDIHLLDPNRFVMSEPLTGALREVDFEDD